MTGFRIILEVFLNWVKVGEKEGKYSMTLCQTALLRQSPCTGPTHLRFRGIVGLQIACKKRSAELRYR